jgi:hypothetical protein
MRLHHKITVN